MKILTTVLILVASLAPGLKAAEFSDVSLENIRSVEAPGGETLPLPKRAQKELYLDTLDPRGTNVQICSMNQDGTLTVSAGCGSWFSKKYTRTREQLLLKVSSLDGVSERDYVLLKGRLVEIYSLYENGRAVLWDITDDSWYVSDLGRVELEVKPGVLVSGFQKGQVVCAGEDRVFDEETSETGVSGLFQPWPYYAKKGSPMTIETLFPSGLARMRVQDRNLNYVLVRLVPLSYVEACK
ncbi:MAG: hypothetical protein M0011_01340 [Elusimicrobia bacterium]|nr:hypothetical protein [Elusimicrobiota bacterium]